MLFCLGKFSHIHAQFSHMHTWAVNVINNAGRLILAFKYLIQADILLVISDIDKG